MHLGAVAPLQRRLAGCLDKGKPLAEYGKMDDNVQKLGLGWPGLTCQVKCDRMDLHREEVQSSMG